MYDRRGHVFPTLSSREGPARDDDEHVTANHDDDILHTGLHLHPLYARFDAANIRIALHSTYAEQAIHILVLVFASGSSLTVYVLSTIATMLVTVRPD